MSTIEATLSMLEAMPEDARVKVFKYTQGLFNSRKPANPFEPVSSDQIMADLAESRQQIVDGDVRPMAEALDEMENKYGFV